MSNICINILPEGNFLEFEENGKLQVVLQDASFSDISNFKNNYSLPITLSDSKGNVDLISKLNECSRTEIESIIKCCGIPVLKGKNIILLKQGGKNKTYDIQIIGDTYKWIDCFKEKSLCELIDFSQLNHQYSDDVINEINEAANTNIDNQTEALVYPKISWGGEQVVEGTIDNDFEDISYYGFLDKPAFFIKWLLTEAFKSKGYKFKYVGEIANSREIQNLIIPINSGCVKPTNKDLIFGAKFQINHHPENSNSYKSLYNNIGLRIPYKPNNTTYVNTFGVKQPICPYDKDQYIEECQLDISSDNEIGLTPFEITEDINDESFSSDAPLYKIIAPATGEYSIKLNFCSTFEIFLNGYRVLDAPLLQNLGGEERYCMGYRREKINYKKSIQISTFLFCGEEYNMDFSLSESNGRKTYKIKTVSDGEFILFDEDQIVNNFIEDFEFDEGIDFNCSNLTSGLPFKVCPEERSFISNGGSENGNALNLIEDDWLVANVPETSLKAATLSIPNFSFTYVNGCEIARSLKRAIKKENFVVDGVLPGTDIESHYYVEFKTKDCLNICQNTDVEIDFELNCPDIKINDIISYLQNSLGFFFATNETRKEVTMIHRKEFFGSVDNQYLTNNTEDLSEKIDCESCIEKKLSNDFKNNLCFEYKNDSDVDGDDSSVACSDGNDYEFAKGCYVVNENIDNDEEQLMNSDNIFSGTIMRQVNGFYVPVIGTELFQDTTPRILVYGGKVVREFDEITIPPIFPGVPPITIDADTPYHLSYFYLNRDDDNNTIDTNTEVVGSGLVDYSLKFNDRQGLGLINRYWEDYLDVIKCGSVVECNVQYDCKDISQMNFSSVKFFHDMYKNKYPHWLIEVTYTIGGNDLSKVKFWRVGK